MEDDAVKKKGKGKQIYEEPRHIEQAKFLPGCRHGTLQIGDVEYCDVPAAMLAKSVQEEEEAESLRAYLNEVLGKNQGSYTDLLNEQIRMSQEKNGDSVQMPTKNIEMVNGTTFMGLLTTDYGFKQVRLPQGTPLEFENMPMDDFEEEVDTMTMYSLPSDDEIVDIECIEAHLKQSKAYDMSKAQGRHTVLVQANNNMISDSTKENENVKNNLQGQMELSVHGEEEMKGQKELPEDGYEIEKNKVRYGTDEELGLNNDSDWRENLFTNMQLEEVGVQENGNGNNIETETEKGDQGTSEDPTNGSQEVTEEWIDEFIRSEQIAASEGNNADTDSKYTPQIDQQFKSREDAHHFFSFYAFIAGFQVKTTHTTRSTSKKRDNEIYKVEIRCVRHGKEKESTKLQQEELAVVEDTDKEERDTNVQVKTDCPVVMVVKLENGFWRIVRLELDHNHELSPGNRNQLFSGRKYMTDMEKAMIRTLNDNNIPTRKMIAILSYLRGGMLALPYKNKDVANLRTKINREVTANDMTKALEYLRKRKAEDPTFFFKFDVDKEMKVRNLFWREGVSLRYYAEYGDCVSFDSTYMTNRYNLPFSPFVGVTGHGHTCLFGCSFLSDESTDTFVWLFDTFLESMGGKHPKTIITDQDKAMKAAIEKVFPNTIHRNCFFHIKYKCYNKNGTVFATKKGLMEEFEDIVNNSLTQDEFEKLWQKMIADNGLENNKYFGKMWQNRKKFIPVYFKDNFFPFLQSTGRSEGTNARLKENVGPTYSVMSFLKEFQRIVEVTNIKEEEADNRSREKRPKDLMFGYNVEKQAMELYNMNIFKRFQFQLQKTETLKYKEVEKGKCYEVWPKTNQIIKPHRIRTYIVLTDLTPGREEFSCLCGKFNKDGIFCSHILKVIIEEEISEIPGKYIIDRWRKKDNKLNLKLPNIVPKTNEILRFNILSRKAAELNSKGSMTDEATSYLCEEFERINIHLDNMIAQSNKEGHSTEIVDGSSRENGQNISNTLLQLGELQDPDRVKTKGRPPKPKRLVPMIEEIKQKLIRKEKKKQKEKQINSSPKGKTPRKRQRKAIEGNSERQQV